MIWELISNQTNHGLSDSKHVKTLRFTNYLDKKAADETGQKLGGRKFHQQSREAAFNPITFVLLF